MSTIILASASPRRREILSGLGVSFTVLSADTDESCTLSDPCAYATELAKRKGQAAWKALQLRGEPADAVILSADTVVATDTQILGKPKDADDAMRMLRLLSGKEHTVVTGVGITVGGVTATAACCTTVRVDHIPPEELQAYINTGDPFDKAGAYGIQGRFSKWIRGIDGCYFNVVGLPVHTLNRLFFEVTGEYLG
ncbi:MAG: septum formation protein Maf [Ruminococcaceae bacterium]|nr:septum formation protein Maf [Oscillospiraceae bacterium]